jgi:two-component system sensor histidine kinase/response regulator
MSDQSKLSMIMNEEPATVLVAEDNVVNQRVMKILLDAFGISADYVSNGRKAVEAMKCKNYELVLMDLQMPEMDGFEATRTIRDYEFARATHIPIIACTAMDVDRERCLDVGLDDYLAKPIGLEELREILERWMKTPLQKALNRLKTEIEAAAAGAPINRKRMKLLYDTDQIEDILKLFLTATEASLVELKIMIADKDVGATWPLAHELKSASYAVSAEEMANYCQQLEQAARREDWVEALKVYTALIMSFGRVKEFLENKTSEVA